MDLPRNRKEAAPLKLACPACGSPSVGLLENQRGECNECGHNGKVREFQGGRRATPRRTNWGFGGGSDRRGTDPRVFEQGYREDD